MKRLIAGLLVVAVVATVLAAPTPALAGHKWRPRHHHGHGGHVAAGIAVGAVTGLVLGGILAPRVYAAEPPRVIYQPAPAYVVPAPPPVYVPAPVCTDYWVPDHWRQGVWVQGHWERTCR